LDGKKCLHNATSSSKEPAYRATGEETLWFEEDSVHAKMLRRQIKFRSRSDALFIHKYKKFYKCLFSDTLFSNFSKRCSKT
jgi:hypothetical protein